MQKICNNTHLFYQSWLFYSWNVDIVRIQTEPVPTEDEDGGFSMDYKAIMHKVVLRYVHKMKFDKNRDSLKEGKNFHSDV